MTCPNKNDINWKILEGSLGADAALSVYVDMNELPNLVENEYFIDNPMGYDTEALVLETLKKMKKEDMYLLDTEEDERFTELTNYLNFRLDQIYAEIAEARSNENFKKSETLEEEKEKILNQIEDIKENNKIESVIEIGNQHLDELEGILNDPNITNADITKAYRLVDLWQNAKNLFIDSSDMLTYQDEYLSLGEISNQFDQLLIELNNILQDKLRMLINDNFYEGIDTKSLTQDIHSISKGVLSPRHINNTFVRLHSNLIKEAKRLSNIESNELDKNITQKQSEIIEELGITEEQLNDLLLGEYEDGQKTGDLVTKIKPEFFLKKNELRAKMQQANDSYKNAKERDKKKRKKRKDQTKKEYLDFLKKNEIRIDVRKLFPIKGFDSSDVEGHKKKLLQLLGEKEFNRYMNLATERIERYNKRKQGKKESLEITYGDDVKQINEKLAEWDIENSPYHYLNYVDGKDLGFYNSKKITPQGSKAVLSIPSDTKWYDDRYSTIENNEKLYEYHGYLINTLQEFRDALPEKERYKIKFNQLPFVMKSLLEVYNGDKGLTAASSEVINNLFSSFQIKEGSSTYSTYRNPLTRKDEMFLKAPDIANNRLVSKYRTQYVTDFIESSGRNPTAEESIEIDKRVKVQIAKEKSLSVANVIRAAGAATIAFKNKAKIEDSVKLVSRHIMDMQDTDSVGEKISKDQSFQNIKTSVESNEANQLYNAKRKEEGKTDVLGKKVVQPKDKKELQDIERKLLDPNISDSLKLSLASRKNEIEKQTSYSRVLDRTMDWLRLKGIGYNPVSAATNWTMGKISAWIEASGSSKYKFTDYVKAEKMMFLNAFGSSKIDTDRLLEVFDFVDDISNEMRSADDVKRTAKIYEPMYLNQKAERNIALPTIIAMMMNKEIDGENLFDVFMNGDMDNDYIKSKEFSEFFRSAEAEVTKAQGDYSQYSNLQGKDNIIGRMLLMYRTWIGESYKNRFAKEYEDVEGEVIKGRYRSYASFLKKDHLKIIPFVSDIIKLYQGKSEMSEVDINNMKKNLTELYFLGSITVGMLSLAALKGDDDDDDLVIDYTTNFLLNQLIRTQTDLLSYVDPVSFKAISQNALPVMQIVTDTAQLLHAAFDLLTGDDIIESGVNAGDRKSVREFMQFFPILSPAYRFSNQITQVFKKK